MTNPTAFAAHPMDPALAGLDPAAMWQVFSDLTRIPRASGNEAGVRDHVRRFAKHHGFDFETNEVGDVLLRVNSGAPGPVVALQAHMDMVCVAKEGLKFDFAKDPIHLVREGDVIHADGTSLGADNGIGIAYALALALEVRGPLEVLLTVDEERGFSGIDGVAPGWLKAKALINIDSEEEGFFTIASAGARDFRVRTAAERAAGGAFETFAIKVDGLKGGHSGVDIHRGRTNALKVMGQVLGAARALGGAVYGMEGGTAPNVIPSTAGAVVGVPAGQKAALLDAVSGLQRKLASPEDPDLKIAVTAVAETRVPLTSNAAGRLCDLLDRLPTGVIVPSQLDPTQPFVSNNLAVAREPRRPLRAHHDEPLAGDRRAGEARGAVPGDRAEAWSGAGGGQDRPRLGT
ncbi:MAG: M20/M25/M40 family metallo-hydrolase [Myxococcales bacterium]